MLDSYNEPYTVENFIRIVSKTFIKGLYLKLVLSFHEKAGTLDKDDVNMDGKLDVLDPGAIFTPPIPLEQLQKVLEGEIGDKKSTISNSESSC